MVTTPGGNVTKKGGYTYVGVPTVTGITPATGPLNGSVPVTISGTGFVAGQTTVLFGGKAGKNVQVSTDGTQMTVDTPAAGTAGPVDVMVTTPGGNVTKKGGYTYVGVPTVTGITPATGPLNGSVPVTISGTGFVAGQTTVLFGGKAGKNVQVSTDGTQMTVDTPAAGTAGPVDVMVTTPGGNVTKKGGYTYVGVPTVTGITPATGPLNGSVPVTISGTGFVAGQTTVLFGGKAGKNVQVSTDGTQMTVDTPAAGTAGPVDVMVTTPGGNVTKKGGYTYVGVPTVTGITPATGPLNGSVPVTISGTGFVAGQTTVLFGGKAGKNVQVSTDGTQMTVDTPAAGTAGPVDVMVTTPGGNVTKKGGYTYVDAPAISSLSPYYGDTKGGTLVTITGTSFSGASRVTFGGVQGNDVRVNGAGTQITVISPPMSPGRYSVVVVTPGGPSVITPPVTNYTYPEKGVDDPIIYDYNPKAFNANGGEMKVTGLHFSDTVEIFESSKLLTTVTGKVNTERTELIVPMPKLKPGRYFFYVVVRNGSMTRYSYVAAIDYY